MLDKPAVTTVPIHELLAQRWSPRAFDATRAVGAAQLQALFEAARWAPSCNGDEPWRFLVWNRATDPAGWQQACEFLSDGNRKWCVNVPVLALSCAATTFTFNGKPNRFGGHDTGMANLAIALQAVALGLVVHQMGGFDAAKARAACGVPGDYTPMSMLAIGYQAAPDVLDEDTRKKELAARRRKPLAETVFAGRWGTAAGW